MKTLFFLLIVMRSSVMSHRSCVPRRYNRDSIVCVCNATYCDDIPHVSKAPSNHYLTYTSSQSGLRLELEQDQLQPISEGAKDEIVITVDSTKKYQSILGWGGAFVDAAGIVITSLSASASDNLLRSYFSENGLEYKLCRVPIGGTDFSTHGYSYDDGDVDPELKNFKLTSEDYKYKIPLIKAASKLSGGELELFASAWTAPVWMKHNGKYTGPDSLRKDMYQPWANYMIKFLEAYSAEGISFWGITTGNEPVTGLILSNINSVGWSSNQMRDWIANNFGPTIRNSQFSSIKIIALDDQSFTFFVYTDKMFRDERVRGYVDGLGLHWYWNDIFPYYIINNTHYKYPDKFILATEACNGVKTYENVLLGEWDRAETYAFDIIADLNSWVTGWIDWSIALDTAGGPTYVTNFADSPVIVNDTADEFYKQPMYYALAHFTKFLPKGSERIYFTKSGDVDVVSFIRPDNGTVVVILNRNKKDMTLTLQDVVIGKEIKKNILSKSITTILYW